MSRASHSSDSVLNPCLLLAPRWKRVPSELIPKTPQACPRTHATRKRGGSNLSAFTSLHLQITHVPIESDEVIGNIGSAGGCPVTPQQGFI